MLFRSTPPTAMKTQNHSATLRTMVLGLLGATALLTSWGSPEQRLAVSLVTALTPGVLAALLMLPALDPRGHWDVLDVAALSVCLAITIIVVLTGIVVALAGQVPATWLLLAVVATLLSLASRADNIRPPHVRVSWEAALHALILIIVAAPVRLIDLGFSEYQGDEASILHRAAAIVQGVDSALLSHRKGPGEILFTTFFGQVVGRVAESERAP